VTDKERALERLLDVATDPNHVERARTVAVQWPSLAAALGELLAAYEMPVPRPLRAAARLLAEERMDPEKGAS
jgi:hypothetical protein